MSISDVGTLVESGKSLGWKAHGSNLLCSGCTLSFLFLPCTLMNDNRKEPILLALLAVLSLKHPTMMVAFPRSRAQCQIKSSPPTRLPDSPCCVLNFPSHNFYCSEHNHGGSALLTGCSGKKCCVLVHVLW